MPNLAVDVDSWARSACYPRSTFYPLSDGPSTRGRRITRADFRPCSARLPRSQARLCSCAPRTVADRPERTLRAPPLLFGRRPPQSNCPPDNVPLCDSAEAVRIPAHQGWYSKGDSKCAGAHPSLSPTYPIQSVPKSNIKLQ